MWTAAHRRQYDRTSLRYPSDLTDAEWALAEPLIPPALLVAVNGFLVLVALSALVSIWFGRTGGD